LNFFYALLHKRLVPLGRGQQVFISVSISALGKTLL
jgi:hypothetical protein